MKNYDFEVLVDEINSNKEKAQIRSIQEQKRQKRYRVRRWVKVVLWTLLVGFLSIAFYQMFTITTIHTTPVGTYTCKGKLIQVCGGSKEVADYLGV